MNEKGQTLVIIIILMIVSLSIGIGVSSRFIKRLSNVAQVDLASKALAVSEAAIENVLLIPATTLEDYALNGTCGADCFLQITGDDNVIATANVELSRLGNSSDPFLVDLSTTDSSQVSLQGYPAGQDISVCWNDNAMSVTALYVRGTQGSYGADAYSYNAAGSAQSNGFNTAAPANGYASCFTFQANGDSVMLRLKSVYSEGFAVVIPAGGATLPTQGILAESTGTAGSAVKKVSVIVTDPLLPGLFDYTLYQKSTSEALSN